MCCHSQRVGQKTRGCGPPVYTFHHELFKLVLNLRDFVPQGHLAMSSDILRCHS